MMSPGNMWQGGKETREHPQIASLLPEHRGKPSCLRDKDAQKPIHKKKDALKGVRWKAQPPAYSRCCSQLPAHVLPTSQLPGFVLDFWDAGVQDTYTFPHLPKLSPVMCFMKRGEKIIAVWCSLKTNELPGRRTEPIPVSRLKWRDSPAFTCFQTLAHGRFLLRLISLRLRYLSSPLNKHSS